MNIRRRGFTLLEILVSLTVLGLILAFIRYRKPRDYRPVELPGEEQHAPLSPRNVIVATIALAAALALQLYSDSIILGALVGFLVFSDFLFGSTVFIVA